MSTVLIIGAGISGLSAARRLVAQGKDVVVLDKGRGPGGRTSRRRRGDFAFDHGAQYFTARDPGFQAELARWREAGAVALWEPRLAVFGTRGQRAVASTQQRWVGTPGMSALPRHMSEDLDVRYRSVVTSLAERGSQWTAFASDGEELGRGEAALLAMPPLQAAPLLTEAGLSSLAKRAESARMRPCWVALLGFDEPLPASYDAAFVNEGPLSWVARNSSKPGRNGGETWVLHATMDWSEAHLRDKPAGVAGALGREFASRCLGRSLPTPSVVEAHRWRYAQPEQPLDEDCLIDPELRIGAAGDWCGGPRIEGAWLSGLAWAEQLLATERS